MVDYIRVRGAAGHNLRSIDVDIPRNQLTVITGVSGSGKSTLAFDTLFAEGQRRYVESLSAYARQFLDQLQKPVVDRIDGLSPAIAIEQRHGGANPRSTVATTTEIHDFLRLLYANAGTPHCPGCGVVLQRFPAEAVVERLLASAPGTKCVLLSPQPAMKSPSAWKHFLVDIRKRGYLRLRLDGALVELEAAEVMGCPSACEVAIDRLVLRDADVRTRLTDSVELALREGTGRVIVLLQAPDASEWQEQAYSEDLVCEDCQIRFGVLTPRHFSFNSPHGACPVCDGLGVEQYFDTDLLVPDPKVPLEKGAIPAWRMGGRALVSYYRRMLKGFMAHFLIAPGTPIGALDAGVRQVLLEGSGNIEIQVTGPRRSGGRARGIIFEGVIPNLKRRYRETESEAVRVNLRRFMRRRTCPSCGGGRLRPESAACRFHAVTLVAFLQRSVDDVLVFLDTLSLQGQEIEIAGELVREIRHRVHFLHEAGLGYLTLDRQSSSLSGGEAQRLRLASQLGAGLTGVLYVLDEPTIGLHEADNARLIRILKHLRDSGNTVVVVEHDETMIREADYVIDLGPGAGPHGGTVTFAGKVPELLESDCSSTAQYLQGKEARLPRHERLVPGDAWLKVQGASAHNLKNIDVAIPLQRMVCVSGVSGSGKSSLVHDVISCALGAHLQAARAVAPGAHTGLVGVEHLNKLIEIDQSPIGRSPRSNPVTYSGAFDPIRKLFAATPSARVRGYDAGRFSFNRKGGRCDACEGDGQIRLEMHFLPDVYVTCERCGGRRYNQETLAVTYGGYSIADVLDASVDEALALFGAIPAIARRLQALADVGLGYLRTGQSATTLSGGEAQRVKLATELSRTATGRTLYILDEPTTGLHFADVRQLLAVLFRLRDAGNTVLMIEHNLDVLAASDYVIDLGPDGGVHGGYVVAAGAPAEVALQSTKTGKALRSRLGL